MGQLGQSPRVSPKGSAKDLLHPIYKVERTHFLALSRCVPVMGSGERLASGWPLIRACQMKVAKHAMLCFNTSLGLAGKGEGTRDLPLERAWEDPAEKTE